VNHSYHDKVGLALASHVAAMLPAHPEWIDLARANLQRWLACNAQSRALEAVYIEWQRILRRPVDEIQTVLRSAGDEGQRLRQNSPFAGALSPREVWSIKQSVRDAQATP
jgi:hypothetical protein